MLCCEVQTQETKERSLRLYVRFYRAEGWAVVGWVGRSSWVGGWSYTGGVE